MARSRAIGLRRSVLRGRRSQRGTGGWRGGWRDRFDIPKAEAEPILLTPGEYPDPDNIDEETEEMGFAHFHTCKSHGVKLKPKGPGSYYSDRCNLEYAQTIGQAEEANCLPCLKREQGDRRIGLKSLYSFNVVHFGIFEKQPVERDGKKVRYERDGENHKRGDVVMQWGQVTRPRDKKEILEEIDDLIEEEEVVLARKKYVEVGLGFRDQLTLIDEDASKFCRCGGNVAPEAFECERCEEELISVEEENLSPKEVEDYSVERQKCDHCGHVGLPVPIPVCDNCNEPEPLTFAEVVAYVRRVGEGNKSQIRIEKVVPITEFELPNGASIIEWEEDPNDEDEMVAALDEDGNYVFTEEYGIRKLVQSQFNFEKVHRPRDHSWHAKKLGCKVPSKWKSVSSSSKYANYEDDEDNGAEEEETSTGRRRTRRRRRSRAQAE